jgi:signal transduction histidine kinase
MNHQDVHHRQLDTIMKFSTLLNSSLNIEDVLDCAMMYAENFMAAEASSIYELDETKNQIFIRLARGEKKEPIKTIRLTLGEGIAGWVVQSGQPMVIQDVRKEARFSDKFDRMTGFKTRSMICVPLILRDSVIGALQVLNKKTEASFGKADLELLTSMAQQIVVAMENAKLYQRLEKKFEMTAQELKRTQEKLIRSERLTAMGHLVQGVAHEIRNPIMTIGGFSKRIKKALGPRGKLHQYVDIILDESTRLEKLVEQVRRLYEVQCASLSLEPFEPVLSEVLERFRPRSEKQGVHLINRIPDDLPSIEMDAPQMDIVLSNLMENALEAMGGGGSLHMEAKQEGRQLLISFRDTGCGIPEDDLNAVYDPFVTSKTRGAGLGLTMVHQIVQNHHGEIRIESKPEEGTLVSIRFPLPTTIPEEAS